LFPYLLDAAELFEAGLDAEKIDNALVKWGMPMGPLRLIDEIGVDITIDIGNTLEKAYGRRDHVSAVLLWLRDGQMLGRKTGAGFYKYEGKKQTPNESLTQWRRAHVVAGGGDPGKDEGSATTQPASPPPATADDLAHRLVFLMVNEAARCVEETVVDCPEDADYGMILGTGFAPFRGGPLRFAEHFGLKKVVDELETLAQSEEKFSPCEILKKHARDGTKFYAE
jgi:3-hydroxyacyl-CoA dehydrogenase/enoyl-CoA hydratase/3-hydroxybutyryl-CoA epimerase